MPGNRGFDTLRAEPADPAVPDAHIHLSAQHWGTSMPDAESCVVPDPFGADSMPDIRVLPDHRVRSEHGD
jgi:hypothetical protein